MDFRDAQTLLRKHQDTFETVMDLFSAREINPVEGEQLLLLAAGISAGLRDAPIINGWSDIAALGWKIAVSEKDRF